MFWVGIEFSQFLSNPPKFLTSPFWSVTLVCLRSDWCDYIIVNLPARPYAHFAVDDRIYLKILFLQSFLLLFLSSVILTSRCKENTPRVLVLLSGFLLEFGVFLYSTPSLILYFVLLYIFSLPSLDRQSPFVSLPAVTNTALWLESVSPSLCSPFFSFPWSPLLLCRFPLPLRKPQLKGYGGVCFDRPFLLPLRTNYSPNRSGV